MKGTVLAFCTSSMFVILSVGQSPRSWKSLDGREVLATGVAVTLDGVLISRGEDELSLLPYAKLDRADSEWAIANLEARVNDDARMSAKSVQQLTNSFQRETGSYAISVDLYRVAPGSYSGSGTITAITETVKERGRVVEVSLSSLKGRGVTAIEFYTVRGTGAAKEASKPKVGIFEFDGLGSLLRFDTGISEKYGGWVVLSRSIRTGEITGAAASMTHLIDFVKGQAPSKVEFEPDPAKLKEFLSARLPAAGQ